MPKDNPLVTLVLGGCRSGKSTYALELANCIGGGHKLFVATCVPEDDEMQQRVQRHQAERGPDWQAIEVPVQLGTAIEAHSATQDVILIDCLTLWVSNLMAAADDAFDVAPDVNRLIESFTALQCPLILVSNEVGMGIVPENALARRYRDNVGWVNQAVAAAADRVVLTVAGIPMTIK